MTRPLRVLGRPPVDVDAAASAVEDLMRALGMQPDDPALARTPQRVAAAFAELLGPRDFGLTTFPNDEGYDELVVARDIPFVSVCEHHLLPFVGTASVGYLPGARILGLSKLARVVELFARRPQVQERMTKQTANWLEDHLRPRGVGVVIRAEHTCMTLRGVRAQGATTVTSALLGSLREDPLSRAEFLSLAT
ncbi:MAG: cyclohydrolase [Frankiaceae bacterium]|nr:cyclohydrolase [Frankiaceae bacterium]